MGISADQFWAQSQNGKAMFVMLARRGDVEIVRDCCDWLITMYRRDVEAGAVQKGASIEQAKIVGQNAASSLQSIADGITDRSVVSAATSIVDAVFQRNYNNGKAAYDKAMIWFANELRRRVAD